MKLLIIFLFLISIYSAQCDLKLEILQVKDLHVHFDEMNKNMGRCRSTEKCYGGFGRLSAKIREIRRNNPNVLLLKEEAISTLSHLEGK